MARPKSNSLDIPWKSSDPCPCFSGMNYGSCCHYSDNLPLIKPINLSPPAKKTSIKNPKCYLNFTENCCKKISREHFISSSVLKQFNQLSIEGMPWQNLGERTQYNPNKLVSKILCQRHNSALSPLDFSADHFFRQIFRAFFHVKKKSVSQKSNFFLVSGEAFELWALKTMLGLHYSKVAQAKGERMHGKYEFNHAITKNAFFGHGIMPPGGVYFSADEGETSEEDIQIAPLYKEDNLLLGGVAIKVCGIKLECIFDVLHTNQDFFKSARTFYRPWIFDIDGKHRTSRIIISWQSNRKEANRFKINLNRSG